MADDEMAVDKLGGSSRLEYMWLVCGSRFSHEPSQIMRCASASKTNPAIPELSGDLENVSTEASPKRPLETVFPRISIEQELEGTPGQAILAYLV